MNFVSTTINFTGKQKTTYKYPGGTPYIPFSSQGGRRSRKKRIANMGEAQMVFLKKDGNYPSGTKFTKPHPIKIPQREFIGKHPKLTAALDNAIKKY